MRQAELEEQRKEIRAAVFSSMDFSKETTDEEMLTRIDDEITALAKRTPMALKDRAKLRREVFHSIRKLDVLQALVDDEAVTEIMINGTENIFIERDGRLEHCDTRFESKQKLEDVIQQMVASCNRVVNEASPIVDARLSGGARVNIVLSPVALNGPVVTIRRFPEKPITMDRLIGFGSLPPFLARYLSVLVRAGYNIFIAGGTGSGKTTFLNALSEFIPKESRVITIEDNAELQITHIPNLVRMEARNANVEGCAEITIRDLIKSSLRMRPDRIVVGEVRGGEAIDMIQAMNTGHDGSMSTGHANSARDMLSRLEVMVLTGSVDLPLAAVRGQIAGGIDIIVHLGRLRDRTRKLLEIAEVTGRIDPETGGIEIRPLYHFIETGTAKDGAIIGEWRMCNALEKTTKLKAAGLALPDNEGGPVHCL